MKRDFRLKCHVDRGLFMKLHSFFNWLLPFDNFEMIQGSPRERNLIWRRNQQKRFNFYKAGVTWMWAGAFLAYWGYVFWDKDLGLFLGFPFLFGATFFISFGLLWLVLFIRLFFPLSK